MAGSRKYPAGSVAIVGLAGRFPGSRDLDDFWRIVRDGVEVLEEFSDEDMEAAGVPVEVRSSSAYVRRGTVLEGVELFDAAFFGFSPREAQVLDPQQRLFLECAWEALEHAGLPPGNIDASVGVYAGAGINTYLISQLMRDPALVKAVGGYQLMVSNDKDFLCTRVSYKLDLRGPSMSIQSACSTSLVAVEVACRALQRGECDVALAGGVSVPFPQRAGYLYQEGMILSPDGHCRPFDALAKGTRPSAGCGIVVLKRLDDAIADGDTIHAVIRGAAINNDGGAKAGYTAPSIEGQAEVIATAMALAGVDARSIGYIEAHGTGTPLGDPIEISALTKVFRESTSDVGFCRIGSLKANLGHLDAAAGVAGLIKAVMVLRRREFPPLVNFRRPNPQLQLEDSPFLASAAASPWESVSGPRRAGVSSFGIGGTNAHVVLEEYCPPDSGHEQKGAELLVLSARTPQALESASLRLADSLAAGHALPLSSVAWTLQTGRRAFEHRRIVIADSTEGAVEALRGSGGAGRFSGAHSEGERPVAFMFSGQGSQFAGMGSGLYRSYSVYRDVVDDCAARLRHTLGCDLRSVLFAPEGDAAINETRFSQPALFVTEYALTRLWMDWGVRAAAMIGHSVGEYVAAHLSGVFSLEDVLNLVAERGRLMQGMLPGRMAAVQQEESGLRAWLRRSAPDVEIAAVNATGMCTIAGPESALEQAITGLRAAGIEIRPLHTSHAFHSAMMEPALEPFGRFVRAMSLQAPRVPYLSNLTGDWIREEEATNPDYYVRHLRSPVLFAPGLRRLASGGSTQLLEVGPGQALTALANIELGRSARSAMATMPRRPNPAGEKLAWMESAGRLWLSGVPISWKAAHEGREVRHLPLPTYPFERRRFWVESKRQVTAESTADSPRHDPLQRAVDVSDFLFSPTWVRSDSPHWDGQRDGRWLVVGGDAELAQAVADRFQARGIDCVVVQDVSHLAGAADGPAARPGFSGIVSLSATSPDLRELDAKRAFFELPEAVERIGIADSAPFRIVAACVAAHCVVDESVKLPDAAYFWGQVLALPHEIPGIEACLLDVCESARHVDRSEIADRIVAECSSFRLEPLVAYRRGRRWLRRFERHGLPPAMQESWPIKRDAVILITGGIGGLGIVLARVLADRRPCRFLLTSRRGLPPKEQWDAWIARPPNDGRDIEAMRAIQLIERAGSEVMVAAVDASDEAGMQAAIKAATDRWGGIDVVVHAAGIAGAGRLGALKTDEDLESVCRPKVEGLRVLTRLLGNRALSAVVLMSSINAVVGAAGVADYAAANAWMDAFAESDEWPSAWPRAAVLDWGAWKETGMAANLEVPAGSRVAWAQYLESSISTAEGAEIFIRAITHGAPRLVVTPFDLREALARQAAPRTSTATDPSIGECGGAEQRDPASSSARPAAGEVDLTTLDGDVEREVARIWVELLGIDRIRSEDDFFALGGHSLMATRVIARIESSFGLRLTLRDVFDAPTLRDLAARIAEKGGVHEDREELEF